MKKYLSWIICFIVIIAITSITFICVSVNYSPKVVARRYLSNLVNNKFENCYAELYIPTRFKEAKKDEIMKIYENFRTDKKSKTKVLKAREIADIHWGDVDKIYNRKEEFDANKSKYQKVSVTYRNILSKEEKANEKEDLYFVKLIKVKNLFGFIPKYKVADNLIASYLYDAQKRELVEAEPTATPKK